MKLSAHFDLAEFTGSDTALRLGIDNSLPADLTPVALETAQMLERIREFLGKPVIITSGYRCLALNRAIGSSDQSDHPRAMAADIRSPEYGTPYAICKALVPHLDGLGIGQIIHEYGAWVHVSTRVPLKVVNRVITIDSTGTRVGIQTVGA